MSPVTRCPDCGWSLELADTHAALRAVNLHYDLRHRPAEPPAPPVPVEPVQQLATVDWRSQALDAITRLAQDSLAAGDVTFTVFEVARYGVGDPDNPRAEWGVLTRDAHHMGLISEAGFTESKRPGTKGSAVKTWRAGPAIRRRETTGRRTA